MVEKVEEEGLDSSQRKKKYVTTWRNKWITSGAGSIDDFIAVYDGLAEKMRRWKKLGITLDPDILGGVGDDYADFCTFDEAVALKEGFYEEEPYEDSEDPLDLQELFFVINEHLTVKKIYDTIQIYVDNNPFNQCMFLFIVDPLRNKQQEEIDSIDEAELLYSNDLEQRIDPEDIGVTKEQEFWGHCSNLQAWAENNYDSRLLHNNLAFPLLRKFIIDATRRRFEIYLYQPNYCY